MRVLIIGASQGLGRALVSGLHEDGHTIIGVSRHRPHDLAAGAPDGPGWIRADMADPVRAVTSIERHAPAELDVIIYNLGVWEERAFTGEYAFLEDTDGRLVDLVNINVTGPILLLKRLIPRLFGSLRPQVVLTGSTSGLRQSGRPEVAFGASKFALTGIADALREGFRRQRLAVTCLQLGYLNTEDPISAPVERAAARGDGGLIPLHDVVDVVRLVLGLSTASFVREIILPAIADERF